MLIFLIAFQPDLVPVPFLYQQACQDIADSDAAQAPPHQPDVTGIEPDAVHETADHGPNRASTTACTLAQAVHRTQHAGMRIAVVDKDMLRRQGKRPAQHLDEENDKEGGPHGRTGLAIRRRGRAGDDGEVRDEEVGDGEAAKEQTPGADRPQPAGHARVQGELHGDADGAENRHGDADGAGLEAETAGEAEG